MIKLLTSILIILTTGTACFSQVIISGTVIAKDDGLPLPGVSVIEKDTKNGAITNADGIFTIEVSAPNSILVFSFVGMRTKEVALKGQREILVEAKWDCNKDFFDSQQIMIYANSGVINNPLGGQIELASPWFLGGVIKGAYSFQTNLNENEFQRGHLELAHFISNCDFDIDFRWDYRQFSFDNKISARANSFETDLNIRNIRVIAGYSHLNFSETEKVGSDNLPGVLLGFGTYFNVPLYPTAITKVSLYKNKVEYQASIHGGHKRLLCFVKFYKVNSFNEISIGIGTRFGYRLKSYKN